MRELVGLDRFTLYLQNTLTEDTSSDSVSNDLGLAQDTRQFLVLEVSGSEYQKMFTSIMEGSDLIYNDESHQITWLLWKAAKSMTLCNAIADCILNSQAVRDALGEYNGFGSTTTTLPVSERQRNLLPQTYTCDNDHRFAMAQGIVEAIHLTVVEIFEAIEVITNPLELLAETVDNVPLSGLISTGADIAVWLQDTMAEEYDLAWSQTISDEIACQLFCAMVDNGACYLSIETIWGVYTDLPITGIPSLDSTSFITDLAAWLLALPLTQAEIVVKAMGIFGVGVMLAGGKFGNFSLGIRTLEQTVQLLADDTNSDWSVLCGTCPGEPIIITFDTITSQDWTLSHESSINTIQRAVDYQSTVLGNPIPALRCQYGITAGSSNGISSYLRITFPTPIDINDVSFEYWYKQPVSNVLQRFIALYDASDNLLNSWVSSSNNAPQQQWVTWGNAGISANNVAYVIVGLSVVSYQFNISNTDGFIDNVRITPA